MTKRQKTWLRNGIRGAVCVLAVWLVSKSITLRDHVELNDPPGRALEGRITESQGFVEVELSDGTVERIQESRVARDEKGDRLLSYGLITAWDQSEGVFLLLSFSVFMIVPFLQAIRIKWLFRAQDIPIGLWESIKVTFAGNFLNFAAPLGATGGDVFKAYYFSLHTTRRTEAVTTVFLDRAIGLGSLVLVVAVIALLSPAGSKLADFRGYTLGFLAIGVVGGVAYLSPGLRSLLLRPSLVERLPMRDQIRRIDSATRRLIAHRKIVIGAVGCAILLQGVAMASYCIVARAMNMSITAADVPEYYAFFATGAIVQSLPGPPQGLGTVELVYSIFFKPYGSASQIVCMALAIRVLALVASLPGAVVALTGAYKPPDAEALQQSDIQPASADGAKDDDAAPPHHESPAAALSAPPPPR